MKKAKLQSIGVFIRSDNDVTKPEFRPRQAVNTRRVVIECGVRTDWPVSG